MSSNMITGHNHTSFTVSDRDFNFRSLLGNSVLRWEWSPGSTLFLVWQQSRSDRLVGSDYDALSAEAIGSFDFGHDTTREEAFDRDHAVTGIDADLTGIVINQVNADSGGEYYGYGFGYGYEYGSEDEESAERRAA